MARRLSVFGGRRDRRSSRAEATRPRHVARRSRGALPGCRARGGAVPDTRGEGQITLGFSPGNLQHTGDPLTDSPPDAAVFAPDGGSAEGVLVAAQRTEKGYVLEAAIPWAIITRLAKTPDLKPNAGMPLNFEVGISDTDGPEPAQEKMMTILTTSWNHVRGRLMAAALAPSDGKAPVVVRGLDLAKGAKLARREKQSIRFQPPAAPKGKEAILVLKARLDTPKAAGWNGGMRLLLNGRKVDPQRLITRQRSEACVSGQMMNSAAQELFNVPYTPDIDAPDKSPQYALRSGAKLCLFELRVSDLLKAGVILGQREYTALEAKGKGKFVGWNVTVRHTRPAALPNEYPVR